MADHGATRRRVATAKAGHRDGRRKSNAGKTGRPGPAGARQAVDRYLALARAAAADGDIVSSQSYYQHADHFYRVMRDAAERTNSQKSL